MILNKLSLLPFYYNQEDPEEQPEQQAFYDIFVSDENDLPSAQDLLDEYGYEPAEGSKAKSAYDGKVYLMDKNGDWHEDTTVGCGGGGTIDAYTKAETDALIASEIEGAITDLDVPSTSTSGHYVKYISQTDGKISAFAETAATAPITGSSKLITSGAVYTALADKVDNSTYASTQLRYEDSGQINLKNLTWTQTSGTSGVWIADAYDVTDIDVIVSVIVTGFGQFRPTDFDMFFTYIPSGVTGMHRVRVVADTNVAQAVVNPYVNLRIFGYGQQSQAKGGRKSDNVIPFGTYETEDEK